MPRIMKTMTDNTPPERVVREVAQRVRQRRESLDLDQDLARYGGPSRATVGLLENSAKWPLRARTRSSWSTALGWQPDAFDRMVSGLDPLEVEPAASSNGDGRLSELVARLKELTAEAERMLEERGT